MADRPRLLLIDDGESYARTLPDRLPDFSLISPAGAELPRLPDGPTALAWLAKHASKVDVVLLDMRFDVPDEKLLPLPEATSPRRLRRFQGVAILREIHRLHPALPVVLLTAVEDLSLMDVGDELAARSMTYLLDGDDLDALRIRVHTAFREATEAQAEGAVLWGRDPAMRTVRRRLDVLSRGRLPVILEGETGTGKSFLAERCLHAASGRPGPFVVLDLATVPTDLIPAHLFGATRGAYTGAVADRKGVFELAHRGTLFIDEVQNVPLEVQKQLLLVLQDRRVRPLGSSREVEVDVKVVAASNQPLAKAVREGRFRSDLYMRLSPATRVALPPLRERPADLPYLARQFTERAVEDPDIAAFHAQVAEALSLGADAPLRLSTGRADRTPESAVTVALPQPAWKALRRHPWPGNLRELEMVMRNIVTFTLVGAVDALETGLRLTTPRLQVDPGLVADLLAETARLPEQGLGQDPEAIRIKVKPADTLNNVSVEVERQYFKTLFARTGGDLEAMAERLLDDRGRARAVRLRMNQLGLKIRELRKG